MTFSFIKFKCCGKAFRMCGWGGQVVSVTLRGDAPTVAERNGGGRGAANLGFGVYTISGRPLKYCSKMHVSEILQTFEVCRCSQSNPVCNFYSSWRRYETRGDKPDSSPDRRGRSSHRQVL